MLEAVILGVNGVLVPHESFHLAGIEAATAMLAERGLPPDRFRAVARERLARFGPTCLISRCLKDLNLALAPEDERRMVLAARRAVPESEALPELRQALRQIAARRIIGFLDTGCPDVLDSLLEQLGLGDLPKAKLWTEALGRTAHPPSGLAFRWLARRFGVQPSDCLYVTGRPATRCAARGAGWRVWPPTEAAPDRGVDPWVLADWIDSTEGNE